MPERTESINNIKIANRYIVEIIKDSRSIQPNLDKYLNSTNDDIRLEYDKMRKRISKIYRKILVASAEENPKIHQEALEKLLKKYRKNDVIEDGTIDALITENKITRNMATSVVNDSATTANICKNLIRISLLLYVLLPAYGAYGTWVKSRIAIPITLVFFVSQSIRSVSSEGLIPNIAPITLSFAVGDFLNGKGYLIDFFAIFMALFLAWLFKVIITSND